MAGATNSFSRGDASQRGLEGEKPLQLLLFSLSFFPPVLQQGMCNAVSGLLPALESPELGCAGKGT